MEWPSWNDFKNGLKQFEDKLSEFEIKSVESIENFKTRHPILDKGITSAFNLLPVPISEMLSNFYESFDNEEEGSKAVLKYIEDLKKLDETHYKNISSQLLQINTDMAKEDTLLLIKGILITTGDEQNKKLDALVSGQKTTHTRLGKIHGMLDEQEKFRKQKFKYALRSIVTFCAKLQQFNEQIKKEWGDNLWNFSEEQINSYKEDYALIRTRLEKEKQQYATDLSGKAVDETNDIIKILYNLDDQLTKKIGNPVNRFYAMDMRIETLYEEYNNAVGRSGKDRPPFILWD